MPCFSEEAQMPAALGDGGGIHPQDDGGGVHRGFDLAVSSASVSGVT